MRLLRGLYISLALLFYLSNHSGWRSISGGGTLGTPKGDEHSVIGKNPPNRYELFEDIAKIRYNGVCTLLPLV